MGKCFGWGIFYYPNLILSRDLNLSIGDSETWGSNEHKDSLSDYFSKIFEYMDLIDITPSVLNPIWRSERIGHQSIAKILEHYLINEQMMILVPLIK